MRTRQPDDSGFVDVGGNAYWWERYGSGEPALLLMGADTIVESRMWKAQIGWFAQRHTVLTFDPAGNGSSDRTTDPAAYSDESLMAVAGATMDAVDVDRVVAIGVCSGAGVALRMAAEQPDRMLGVVAINPGLNVAPPHPHRMPGGFHSVRPDDEGWNKENRHAWLRDWSGYAEFFFGQMLPEPHSTKQLDDTVAWARGTTAELMLVAKEVDSPRYHPDTAAELCRRVGCPVLVINGDRDMCQPPERSRRVAELTGGELLVLQGSGHLPHARDPVRVNLAIADFLRRVT